MNRSVREALAGKNVTTMDSPDAQSVTFIMRRQGEKTVEFEHGKLAVSAITACPSRSSTWR